MKKTFFSWRRPMSPILAAFSFLLVLSNCQKQNNAPALSDPLSKSHSSERHDNFFQINLVANNSTYGAAKVDPALINAWGISFSPTGTFWVSSQGGHVSGVYNREGVTALGPVNIPSPGGPVGGNPTGQVFNPSATDFPIPSGNGTAPQAARFIFAGVDGVISGWNGTRGVTAALARNDVATSAYTGLTLASSNGSNFLYAADFRARKIVVIDKSWNLVSMPFMDPNLPSGYSPFNIQLVGDQLYVLYAKVGANGRSEDGVGKGIVNIFTTSGMLVKRFASKEKLNAPWGVAKVPSSFFPVRGKSDDDGEDKDEDDHDTMDSSYVLIGNFGDGKINVFTAKGKFRGQIRMNNKTLVIERLWAITLPPITSTVDQNRLYFAAGPKEETDGLFGYIIKDSTQMH